MVGVEVNGANWMLGNISSNISFISCVDKDISLVRFAHSQDILVNTKKPLHISAHPCIILHIFLDHIMYHKQYD
jgi:hypothetical protein